MGLFRKRKPLDVIDEAYYLYEKGDKDKAAEIWGRYAEEGYVLAMVYYAFYLLNEGPLKESLRWIVQAEVCDEENLFQEQIDAIKNDIVICVKDIFAKAEKLYDNYKYREAMEWYHTAAECEYVPAQYKLAEIYRNGDVAIDMDKQESIKWYRRAAEHGHADAMFELADMYHIGEGIEADMNEAIKWYKKADEHGNIMAHYMLESL